MALESISGQPHKPENVIQRMSGYDITPHGQREIKYTRCIKNHIDLIHGELEFRGVRFEMGTGIMQLKKQLKEQNMDAQTAAILERTSILALNDNIDVTYFKPLH